MPTCPVVAGPVTYSYASDNYVYQWQLHISTLRGEDLTATLLVHIRTRIISTAPN